MPNFSAQFLIGPSGVVETTNAPAMRTLLGLGSASTVAASAFVGTSPATATANVIQPVNATSGNLTLQMRAGQTVAPVRILSSGGTLLLSAGTGGELIVSPPEHVTAVILDGRHTSTVPTLILHGSSVSNVLHVRDSSDNTTVYVDAQTGVVGAKRIASTVGNGTSPFAVSSTTACTNLNVEFLGGSRAADIISAATSGGSLLQRLLFHAPADKWRGVTTSRPEPSIASVSGMSSTTYALSFSSTGSQYAQLDSQILPNDLTTTGSVAILLTGNAASTTAGSIAYVLGSRQYKTGAWTGAFTDFATIAAALPGNTGSAYSPSWAGSITSLGFSRGHSLSLQIRRLNAGGNTHAGNSDFHGLSAYEVP